MHEIGTVWSFSEVDALLAVRSREPDSWLFAKQNGWRYPVSREWMMMADLYDLTGRAHAGKKWRKGYQRPWPAPNSKRVGRHSLSTAGAQDILAKAAAGKLVWSR